MFISSHLISTSCRPKALPLVTDSAVTNCLWSFTRRLNTFGLLDFIKDIVEHIVIVACIFRLLLTCSRCIRTESETLTTGLWLNFVSEIEVFPPIGLWISKRTCWHGQIVLLFVDIFGISRRRFRFDDVVKESIELFGLYLGCALSGASSTSLTAVAERVVPCHRLSIFESLVFMMI